MESLEMSFGNHLLGERGDGGDPTLLFFSIIRPAAALIRCAVSSKSSVNEADTGGEAAALPEAAICWIDARSGEYQCGGKAGSCAIQRLTNEGHSISLLLGNVGRAAAVSRFDVAQCCQRERTAIAGPGSWTSGCWMCRYRR